MQAMNQSLKMNRAYRRLKKNFFARSKENPISEEGVLQIEPLTAQAKSEIKTKVLAAEERKHRLSMIALFIIILAVAWLFLSVIASDFPSNYLDW
jgi:hypothetical protein